VAAVAAYAMLTAAICLDLVVAPMLASAPRWGMVLVVSAIGPSSSLLLGSQGLGVFIVEVIAVALSLGLAWEAWRRWPESDVFALGIVGAGAIWLASGWLTLAAAW
jgi:hypothetical protein